MVVVVVVVIVVSAVVVAFCFPVIITIGFRFQLFKYVDSAIDAIVDVIVSRSDIL